MKEILKIIIIFKYIFCLENGLGKTPPMGWNSWKKYQCNINEKIIKDTINAIIDKGLSKVGYKYIIIDDCWQKSRDEKGIIIPDPNVFPNGIKSLIDYTHSKGLLFGLLSSAGNKTCMKRPGSLGYEEIDAEVYAKWGIDYLKYVNCNSDDSPPNKRFEIMRDAILKSKRPIYFSISDWGESIPAKWAKEVANSWRTTDDIGDKWIYMIRNIDRNNHFAQYSSPGSWNDPDMLEVGNGGMSIEEYKTHFSLWAISKAPLIIGCDIINMSNDTFNILSNPEVIAINQDSLGIQGKKIKTIQPQPHHEEFLSGKNDVILSKCDGSERQKWDLKSDGSIRNPDGKICLEIPQCSKENIQLQTGTCHIDDITYCDNSKNQLWFFDIDGTISSKMDERICLNVYDFSSSNVHTDRCWKSGSKVWQYSEISKTIEIDEKCLTRSLVEEELEVWTCILSNDSYAVILLNRGTQNATMIARWSEIGLQGRYGKVRDLWERKDLGIFTDFFEVNVLPHSCFFLKVESPNSKSSNSLIIDIIKLALFSLIIFQVFVILVKKYFVFQKEEKQYINVNEYSETQELKIINNN